MRGKAIIEKEFCKRIHCMFNHSTLLFSRVYQVTRERFYTIHKAVYINMIVISKGFVLVAIICIVRINRSIQEFKLKKFTRMEVYDGMGKIIKTSDEQG